MTKSEKIQKEIEAAEQAKAEAQGKINALQAKRESAMTALGDRLMSEPNASTTELDELQAELERLELKAQAYDRRLEKLEAELVQTLDAEKVAELTELQKTASQIVRDAVKAIYELNEASHRLMVLDRRHTQLAGLSRAVNMGLPLAAMYQYTEAWLNLAENGTPELRAMLSDENIPDRLERAKA